MLGSSLTHVFGAVSALCLLGAPVRASDGARNLSPDDDVLQEAKIGSNRAALLDYMHKRSPAGVDPQRLDELIQQLGSMRFQDRQQASKKLVSLGPAILPLLRGAQKDTDTERAARAIDCIQEIERNWNSALSLAVIRAVVHHYPAEAGEALLGFLPHVACDPEVEEEIWFALDRLAARASSQHPAFLNALRDPFPIRRAAAACILGRRGEQRERAVVRHLLADPDPVVRLRCAQGLLAAREKDAIPVLIALLDKTGVDVSWQAEELLHWVAGEDSPAVTIGSGYQEVAATCRQAWKAWWRQQGPRLNLEKLDVDYRKPGLALVSGYEMVRRGKEQQEESHLSLYGCDGKPRWQVKTVPGSSCAELLPNGRLLMPLLDEFGLCEKDLHGNILWQYKLPYPVYSCQRLPRTLRTGRGGRHGLRTGRRAPADCRRSTTLTRGPRI